MGNGWNEITGNTDHDELIRYVLTLADTGYVIRDAKAAIAANPEGRKAGYYTDLVHYCCMRQAGVLKAPRGKVVSVHRWSG